MSRDVLLLFYEHGQPSTPFFVNPWEVSDAVAAGRYIVGSVCQISAEKIETTPYIVKLEDIMRESATDVIGALISFILAAGQHGSQCHQIIGFAPRIFTTHTKSMYARVIVDWARLRHYHTELTSYSAFGVSPVDIIEAINSQAILHMDERSAYSIKRFATISGLDYTQHTPEEITWRLIRALL